MCAGLLAYEPNPVKPKLVKTINAVYKVNMSDETLKSGSIENGEEGNSLSSPVGTITNSPDAEGIDALDESSMYQFFINIGSKRKGYSGPQANHSVN
jgi:hypothetical protein